jgi:hypothetical protein
MKFIYVFVWQTSHFQFSTFTFYIYASQEYITIP